MNMAVSLTLLILLAASTLPGILGFYACPGVAGNFPLLVLYL